MREVQTAVEDQPKDCLACRIVGGVGLVGVGVYIGYQGSLRRGFGKGGMYILAAVAAGLGTARTFDLPPFNRRHLKQEEAAQTSQS